MTIANKSTSFDHSHSLLSEIATGGYFAALHIRFSRPLFQEQTFPPEWVRHYSTHALSLRDPAMAWGRSNVGAIRWSDLKSAAANIVLERAAEFGLRYGAVLAHGPAESHSIVMLSRPDREVTDRELDLTYRSVVDMHRNLTRSFELTPAQSEALSAIAGGQRHGELAANLGISPSALKARLAAARSAMNAKTTTEAIKRASDSGLI